MMGIVELRDTITALKRGKKKIGKISPELKNDIIECYQARRMLPTHFAHVIGISHTCMSNILKSRSIKKPEVPPASGSLDKWIQENERALADCDSIDKWIQENERILALAKERTRNFNDLKYRINFIIGFSFISFAVLSGLSFYLWVMN